MIGTNVRDMITNNKTPLRQQVSQTTVTRAYRRYAPFYDMVFGPAFHFGRKKTVQRMNTLGGERVLEIGVGTGLSLPDYNGGKIITGIDLSDEMLRHASRRVEEDRLDNVIGLLKMDAEQLAFADGAFDVVVAMFVMSVVPDPRRCLAEMQRVCKPEGKIVICNHFADGDNQWTRWVEGLSGWLGWRPNFCFEDLFGIDHARQQVISDTRVPPFGMFRLIELQKPA